MQMVFLNLFYQSNGIFLKYDNVEIPQEKIMADTINLISILEFLVVRKKFYFSHVPTLQGPILAKVYLWYINTE